MGLPSLRGIGLGRRNSPALPSLVGKRFSLPRSPANCIAYFQPYKAASYAASLINLARPGWYDATERVGTPGWTETEGWIFTGGQVLTTCYVNGGGYSAVVRYSAAADGTGRLIGCSAISDGQPRFFIVPMNAGNIYWNNGNAVITSAPQLRAGVLAIAGNRAYRNGVDEGITLPAWTSGSAAELGIGGQYQSNTTSYRITAYIQAVAIYDAVLTAQQVAEVSAALAAL